MEAKSLRVEKSVTADAAAELKPVVIPGAPPTPNVMPKKVPVSVPANG
jgi:hypothetical protein